MIGIITQPLGYNYGGILQNYALQKALKKLGFDSITIDNTYRYSILRYRISYLLSLFLNLIGKRRNLPHKPYKGRNIPIITGKFIFHNINLGHSCDGFSTNTIKKYGIDTLIVGSDQVWRPAYNKSINNMFLDFAPSKCKKISYAASFGTNQWEYSEEETLKCKDLLKSFVAVSVREKSGIELAKQYLNYTNVHFVLDPTLLLEKSDYISLCRKFPIKKSFYLCAYILDLSEEKKHIINSIANKKGLKVHFFSAHEKLTLSVEEWLCNFRDASFVVTDSFHGTVFSIIFEKDFIVFPNNERGKDRFVSLLSELGLLDRIYNNINNYEDTIQWEKVNKRLLSMKQHSLCYLKNNL